jgi:hypothetical protein
MAMIRLSFAAACLASAPLAAQAIPVTITATLSSESGKPLPIVGRFWLVAAGSRDSVAALTDGTGRARVNLAAGAYQLRSHHARDARGPSLVLGRSCHRAKRHADRAQQRQCAEHPAGCRSDRGRDGRPRADSSGRARDPPARAHVRQHRAHRQHISLKPGDPGYKEPGLAVLFGILLAGGGHFYAGEIDKGLGILAGVVLGASLVVSQYCDGYSYDCNDTVAGIGGLLLLGSWIYRSQMLPAAGRASDGNQPLRFAPCRATVGRRSGSHCEEQQGKEHRATGRMAQDRTGE